MTNNVYVRAKATAARKLKQYGRVMTVTAVDGSEFKGYGVIVDSETDDGAQGRDNEKVIYFTGTDKIAPSAGAIVAVGEDNWAVVKVNDINPDGTLTIVYELQVAQ